MWPFRKTPRMTPEEYAVTRPPAPCGKQTEHVFWTELQGMACPVCAGIEMRKRQEEDEDRMAKKIAAAVVSKLSALPAVTLDDLKGGA